MPLSWPGARIRPWPFVVAVGAALVVIGAVGALLSALV